MTTVQNALTISEWCDLARRMRDDNDLDELRLVEEFPSPPSWADAAELITEDLGSGVLGLSFQTWRAGPTNPVAVDAAELILVFLDPVTTAGEVHLPGDTKTEGVGVSTWPESGLYTLATATELAGCLTDLLAHLAAHGVEVTR